MDLQSLGEGVHDTGDLGQPHDPPIGDVGDVRLADERHHVVLAVAVDLDVAHEHELVVALDLGERPREVCDRILTVATKVLPHRTENAFGGFLQTLSLRVIAHVGEKLSDALFGFFFVRLVCHRR